MADLPQKAPFRCPRCGFVQLEPAHLVSTYCRACGDYHEVPRSKSSRQKKRGFAPFPVPAAGSRKPIFCHKCGATHPVSIHAKTTMCPRCNSAIDLCDISFFSPASRPVDTRGCLLIGPDGSLSNSWIVCGSARIEGAVMGMLLSEGEVRIATSQHCVCRISAPTVVIERYAALTAPLPVDADHLIVRGRLDGIVNCRGTVHVMRGGHLHAQVRARAIVVEKGGFFIAGCHVDNRQPEGHGVTKCAKPTWPIPEASGLLCPG